MLALFLLAQHVLAKDTSNDSYIVKKIESCPDEGYFFKRDINFNIIEPNCYLCFCQDNGTAVCWLRPNNRCDTKYYYHAGRKKREIRSRRSPGLSDIFFRDASRDFFNKRMPEQCKPHESSFSEGCPPADWCIGCTVCDCDANGRWDCHVLSFCPDGTGKKQMKKRRGSVRSKIMKRQLATNKERDKMRTTTKTTKKPTRKSARKNNRGNKPQIKQNKVERINGKQRKQQKKPNRRTQPKKPKPPCPMQNSTKGKSKKSILKSSKSKDLKINKNDMTAKFAESILKKVMASVEKFINESQKNSSKSNRSKNMKKRPMSKHKKGNNKNSVNTDSNKIKSKILNDKIWSNVSSKKANEKIRANWRRKRDVETQEISNKLVLPLTVTNSTTPAAFHTYNVDLKDENKTTVNEYLATATNDVLSTLDQTTGYFSEGITNHINEEMITQTNEIILNRSQKSLKTFLNTHKERNSSDINLHFNKTSYNLSESCGKICELKKTIREVIVSFNKINTTRNKTNKVKANHYNILTNLKKVFRKIFLKKTNLKNVTIDRRMPFRKRKIIKVLCKNIDSCKINHDNTELQFKLDKLRVESLKILKSVRVIKGLLKLLDIHENNAITDLNYKQFNDNYVNKLNVILKDEYATKYGITNLTETQQKQINYAKENTLIFVESIEKFSKILIDVINILKNGDKRNQTHFYHNYAREQEYIKTNNSKTINDKLIKLINLLVKYNLVQNKFMKKMYDILVTLEDKANTTFNDKLKEVSVENIKSDYPNTLENYIKNIFKNLRKLKALPERLNSKIRKKRAAIYNDDAVEYLLMLMEYLFKQNKPSNLSPVHDGIDLLIETIKNAPDIKPIQKEVFYNGVLQTKHSDDSINFHGKNVIAEEYKDTISIFNNKFKPYESTDNEHEYFNDYKDFNKEIQTSTQPNSTPEEVKIQDLVTKKTVSVHVDENTKLDKFNEQMLNKDRQEEIKRYEVFVDDTAEDDMPLDTTTIVIDTSTVTVPNTESLHTPPTENKTMNNYEASNSDDKIKLEWIEETYDNGPERENNTKVKESTTEANEKVTKKIKKIYDKYADPVSSMSHEDGERKLYTDSESYHKQTSLLNSLDYIPDRELDSDSREEKDNVDSSPLYFV
ncbi:uncharacterized protein LOC113395921 [Vanessa tameamea]|uniref:Uncharacterized protein LOC113395921 n=1 Tax=Vanessa tameamea TaxID=334116 RepID=A0ABM4AUV1_VANTA